MSTYLPVFSSSLPSITFTRRQCHNPLQPANPEDEKRPRSSCVGFVLSDPNHIGIRLTDFDRGSERHSGSMRTQGGFSAIYPLICPSFPCFLPLFSKAISQVLRPSPFIVKCTIASMVWNWNKGESDREYNACVVLNGVARSFGKIDICGYTY